MLRKIGDPKSKIQLKIFKLHFCTAHCHQINFLFYSQPDLKFLARYNVRAPPSPPPPPLSNAVNCGPHLCRARELLQKFSNFLVRH